MFRIFLCHTDLSVSCILVVGHLLERADLLALLCMMFFLCFVTFPYDVLCQVWIPDLSLLLNFFNAYSRYYTIIVVIIVFDDLTEQGGFDARN